MKKSVSIIAFPFAFLSDGPALAQSMCVIESNPPIMGANMNPAFDVQAGEGMHVRH
jgi:hypothetical protein